jgi:filamentous hemagglutinin family protein
MPTAGLQAGDILRGRASAGNAKRNSEARANAGAAAAEAAKVRAQDRLARTTKAVNDMRTLQASARAAAGASAIPNGITQGGLQPQLKAGVGIKAIYTKDDFQNWEGADAPTAAGNNVNIKQTAAQALLHWETFNVGSQTTVNFDQSAGGADSGKWIAFNKVVGASTAPSEIRGKINAQGQVYIINQNGIIFGAGSQVNARTLVASSLPINDNLVQKGLLNQPKGEAPEFLFSALRTGSFDPGSVTLGEGVVVERGATLTSPLSSEGSGGRVMLVGPRVTNDGIITTPSGQTILAAGLQVGMFAHSNNDPSLRGLDVYVGKVTDPTVSSPFNGEAVNTGLIEAQRGGITIAGRMIHQNGIFLSTTSVDVNGRIDLLANFDSVANASYDPDNLDFLKKTPFFSKTTGLVDFGSGSSTLVLPEWESKKTITSVNLPLQSYVNVQSLSVHFRNNSMLIAPSGKVEINAGKWNYPTTNQDLKFVYTDGQVYFDQGSLVDVSGSTNVFVPLAQSILTLQLRGAQLSDSPLQRSSSLRAVDLTMDMRKSGKFYGKDWVGTPLGDLTGYLNLIPRNVSQLTLEGGDISIKAGQSVVLKSGATLDVSGGYTRNEVGRIQTTRLLYGTGVVDIANATPDRIYGAIYDGKNVTSSGKWGVSNIFSNPLSPLGGYSQSEYISGANGGSLALTASAMALDGKLLGATVIGPRQVRSTPVSSSLPSPGSLELDFKSQDAAKIASGAILRIPTNYYVSPTPPVIFFNSPDEQTTPDDFKTLKKTGRSWDIHSILDIIKKYSEETYNKIYTMEKNQIVQPESDTSYEKLITAFVKAESQKHKFTWMIGDKKLSDTYQIYLDNRCFRIIISIYYGSKKK